MRCFILLICFTLFLANECQGKPFFFHHFACNIICPAPFSAKGCVFCHSSGNVAKTDAYGSSSDPKSKISASSNVNINNGSEGGEATTAAAGGETTTTEATSTSEATTTTTTTSTTPTTSSTTPSSTTMK